MQIELRETNHTIYDDKHVLFVKTNKRQLVEEDFAAIKIEIFFEALLFYLNFYYKRYVYVRPCTKYPTHGIKACVAKQGDTLMGVFLKLKSRGYNETFFEKPRASSLYYGGGAIAKTILVPRSSKQEFTKRWLTNKS
ncbi:hypothetical protein BpHYR1_039091 [Brachionus plicatilis]|uniref:Uncharacterized protein n=1 Tax=Brachionus plicatilis TaxID=10195 RepID=A0A3M7RZ53_BRAPC|nr:hypothetical protein BpHYR1_039091 [Brachionus plicatilis]